MEKGEALKILYASVLTENDSSLDRMWALERIRSYLLDEAARERIAASGRVRAERDGYHDERQVGLILERVRPIPSAAGAGGY